MVSSLTRQGLAPVVWFDANAGYLIAGRCMGPAPLGCALGLPPDQVYVAPKGTPADPQILHAAQTLSARVVTNDRYRDWTGTHHEVTTPGFLIRGRFEGDSVRLEGL